MPDIKTKKSNKGTIKTIDKSLIATQKTKKALVDIKEKGENQTQVKEQNSTEYATNSIEIGAKKVVNNFNSVRYKGNNEVNNTKSNIIKTRNKIKNIKTTLTEKKKLQKVKKGIKTNKQIIKNTQKVAKESVKVSQRAIKLAKETAKKTSQTIKVAVKTTVSTVKLILASTKALISALIAGGWVSVIIILVICLIGLLCSSVFGIFFSGEKTGKDTITMKDVIYECNQEFSNKLQSIQDENPHDEYVLDGNLTSWKDMLLIYTVKVSNGNNQQDVITIDDNKKAIMKEIFWDMNSVSSEVRDEVVTEQGVNTNETPKEVEKKVLHIKITTKSVNDMKTKYGFNQKQIKQLDELSSEKYSSLWGSIVYGVGSGEYTNWRQYDSSWANVRIGNTSSTIKDIGCLVTSVAILIKKAGVSSSIKPFNPGTFVEALNKNGGFDEFGNLQYAAISKVVPNFKFVGKVNLNGKTRQEKFSLIKQYFESGYFITIEVKGAVDGNQHWVAIVGINANDIIMVDPGSNQTNLWNAYEFSKSSQFNFFKAD